VPQLAAVETVDNGSLHEAMALRVLPRGANNVRFFADFAVERLAEPERTLHGGERNRVRYDPAGVTAVSTPWNAPFMLATWRVGPALAAGNTVVLKPPEWAPLTCSMLGDLADEAGLPPGVLNIVHGSGAEAGAPLTGHPDVDRVAFTGSPATARTVYRDAAAQLTPGLLRARRQVAVPRLRGRRPRRRRGHRGLPVRQLGQVCLAGTRLLVQESIQEEFLERPRGEGGRDQGRRPARGGHDVRAAHPSRRARAGDGPRRPAPARAAPGWRSAAESLGGLYFAPTLFADVRPTPTSCATRSSAPC
jgi:acyl-CoA reductase-like NAD-dependent aldehyde dehydrogenase